MIARRVLCKLLVWFSVAILFASAALSASGQKRIVPTCYAQIDPSDQKLILAICDFSGLSVAQKITRAEITVEITDSAGSVLGMQKLQLVDEKHPIIGGSKYNKKFECATKNLPNAGVTLKIPSGEAIVEPIVAAAHN